MRTRTAANRSNDRLVKAAKLFANCSHQRIAAQQNPAWQSIEVHLKSGAEIVSSVSSDEETIAAAWLHEIVEDTAATIGDIERQYSRKTLVQNAKTHEPRT